MKIKYFLVKIRNCITYEKAVCINKYGQFCHRKINLYENYNKMNQLKIWKMSCFVGSWEMEIKSIWDFIHNFLLLRFITCYLCKFRKTLTQN